MAENQEVHYRVDAQVKFLPAPYSSQNTKDRWVLTTLTELQQQSFSVQKTNYKDTMNNNTGAWNLLAIFGFVGESYDFKVRGKLGGQKKQKGGKMTTNPEHPNPHMD